MASLKCFLTMFILFLHSLCLSTLFLANALTVEDVKVVDDVDDWLDNYRRNKQPWDWNKLTLPPDLDKKIVDDDWLDFFRRTSQPLDFEVPTFPPRDPNVLSKLDDHSAIYFVVFLIFFVIIVAVFAYLRYTYEQRYTTTSILTISASRERTRQRSLLSDIERSVASERSNGILEFNNPSVDLGNTINSIDIPPRYEDVVKGDTSGQMNFPEVTVSTPETPPPSYKEENPTKY